jgi:hypothetical protein
MKTNSYLRSLVLCAATLGSLSLQPAVSSAQPGECKTMHQIECRICWCIPDVVGNGCHAKPAGPCMVCQSFLGPCELPRPRGLRPF